MSIVYFKGEFTTQVVEISEMKFLEKKLFDLCCKMRPSIGSEKGKLPK